MASAGTIQGTFGWDNTPFLQGMNVAERRAQTFSARTEKALKNTFRQHGSTQVALAGLGQDLLRGDVAGAIQGITMRMAGLGLAAGVGVAVAADAFVMLKEQVESTRKAQENLEATLSRPVALNVQAGNAEQLIGALKTQAEELDKQVGSTAQKILDSFKFGPFGSGAENAAAAARQQLSNEAVRRAQEAERERGRMELEAATARTDPTDTGRLTEIYNKFRQREAAIRLTPDKGTKDRLEALRREEEFVTDQVVERTEARDREFASAKKLVELQSSNLPEETKKKVAAQLRVRDIDEELQGRTLTTERRQKLELERAQQNAILRTGQPPTRSRFGGFERRWDDQDFQGAERFMNNPFGSIADRFSEKPTETQNLSGDLLKELQTLNSNMTKYWGGS